MSYAEQEQVYLKLSELEPSHVFPTRRLKRNPAQRHSRSARQPLGSQRSLPCLVPALLAQVTGPWLLATGLLGKQLRALPQGNLTRHQGRASEYGYDDVPCQVISQWTLVCVWLKGNQ